MIEYKIFNQIVIRFSLRVKDWQIKASGSLEESARVEWFNYRVSIFNNTVIPSLINQKKKANRLILLFDNNDSHLWKNNFLPFLNHVPFQILPIFQGWDFSSCLKDTMFDVPLDYSHVNNIRMDSDDLLQSDFIAKNNNAILINGADKYIIFPYGIRFDKKNWQRLYYVDNPFLSYCVERGAFHNIMSINHEKVRDHDFFIIDENQPMWAQYVHGSNVSNKFRDLQVYDGFKSYPLEPNSSIDYATFGLDIDLQNQLVSRINNS